MYHYIMLELTYEKAPVVFTVTNNFGEAVELLRKVLNADNDYLNNAYIESHEKEQFDE